MDRFFSTTSNFLTVFFIGFASFTAPAWAINSDADCQPFALPELINIALQNNPETKIAWQQVQRSESLQDLARSDYYPELNLNADLVNGRTYRFPKSHEVSYTTAGINLAFSYLLFDFGERDANYNAAIAAAVAANWQKSRVFQKVVFDVLSNTYKYLNAVEILESRLESLQDTETVLSAVEDLNKIGLRSITDVYTVRSSYSEMQMEVARQKAEVDTALNKVITVLGLKLSEAPLIAQLPDPSSQPTMKAGLNQLLQMANEQRADLLAKRASIMERQAQLAKSKASYLPTVRVGGNAGYNRYFDDRTDGFTYKVGLFLDYPLFDGFSESAQSRLNFADLQIANEELERTELDVVQEILDSSRWFQTAQEVFELSKTHLENSYYSFEGTLEKYKSGTQSIFDLIAAQKLLAQARIQHGKAKLDWYRTLAQLAYATGNVMSYTENACINIP